MRLNINLATQPYENARRFYLVWGGALLGMALLTAALVYGAVSGWRHTHALNRQIAAEQANLQKLNALEEADLEVLDRPGNRDVRDTSQALNSLIRRKEFSWTRIFTDLEKLMPDRLHVVSITPRLTADNQIEVHMMVAGNSRDSAILLVQHMEQSPDFRNSQILTESNTQSRPGQTGDTVQFEISALYVPNAEQPPAPAEAAAPAERGGN